MMDHLHYLAARFPGWFDSLGWPLPGHPLFPDASGGVCTKAGVTATIQDAASQLGQPLRDGGGLPLHTGHALRVTGAQGLARAGLTEHLIALVARWGSDAVLRYIRSAPLTSSHRLSAQALAGWQSHPGSHGMRPPPPVREAVAAKQPRKRIRTSGTTDSAAQHAAILHRLAIVEAEVAKLAGWRAEVANTLASSASLPAPVPAIESVVVQTGRREAHPYILSKYGRFHVVVLGYPENPRHWVTACGWRFGASVGASPVASLSGFYKAYCERCLTAERELAKAAAKDLVSEDGPVHKSPGPSTFAH